jgi:hypothetical protein
VQFGIYHSTLLFFIGDNIMFTPVRFYAVFARYCATSMVIILLHCSTLLFGQEQQEQRHRWGVELELIQPFVPTINIFTAKVSHTLFRTEASGQQGDLLVGVFVRPNIEHDVVQRIEEYAISVGYRHYFWQGLHAEAQYFGGYVWGRKNLVDGKDYQGFVQLASATIGYRFTFGASPSLMFYVLPQVGVLGGLNPELIIGPRNGKPDVFLDGRLLVGIMF